MSAEFQFSVQVADYLKLWQTLFFLDVEHLLRHPDEVATVDLVKLADHSRCKTGQWLAEQDDSIRTLPEFKAFDHAHRQFHNNVAVTLKCLINAGGSKESDSNEDVAHSYDRAVVAVDQLIKRLRQLGVLDASSEVTSLRLWDPSFELGIEELDRQHQTIMTLLELATPKWASPYVGFSTKEIIRKLFKLIRAELDIEAPIIQQMINAGIESAKDHKEAHLGLLLLIDAAEAGRVPVNDLASTLGSWYVEHLILYDEEMRNFSETRHCNSATR